MTSAQLKEFVRGIGADCVGVADLMLLGGIQTDPKDLLDGYSMAVSMAVRLADGIIDPITNDPTPLYQQHYLKVTAFLDILAIRVSQFLQAGGARALPIPASQILDRQNWFSYISHKAVAIAAGLGWQGKSLLLVTPDFGPRVRLVTVLTDAALESDQPVENRCGKCSLCAEACPVQAIKNVNTERHYENREEALHMDRCVERVTNNPVRLEFIESPICGVCIRACPWGSRKSVSNSQKS